MTRRLFVSPVIVCFFISMQCQRRLSGRSGSEELGGFGSADLAEHWAWTDQRWLMDSDALSSKRWNGIRGNGLAGIHCKAMSSRMRSRMGSKALAKEALAKEALARRPLWLERYWPEER